MIFQRIVRRVGRISVRFTDPIARVTASMDISVSYRGAGETEMLEQIIPVSGQH
jgi:hypothetical protein